MKCKKIESFIYVYNELDEQEKQQVNTHVDGCLSCQALFAQINHQHSLIRKVGEIPVFTASPERIKRYIMQVIEARKEHWSNTIISMVRIYWLRTSFAVASILLAGFFFTELSTDYSRTVINAKNTVSNNIRLNTPKFLKAHADRRESTNQISFYDCLKHADCDFLKNLKPNKNL